MQHLWICRRSKTWMRGTTCIQVLIGFLHHCPRDVSAEKTSAPSALFFFGIIPHRVPTKSFGCKSCHALLGGHSNACRSRFERIWADEDSIKATAEAEKDARQVRSSATTKMVTPSTTQPASGIIVKFECQPAGIRQVYHQRLVRRPMWHQNKQQHLCLRRQRRARLYRGLSLAEDVLDANPPSRTGWDWPWRDRDLRWTHRWAARGTVIDERAR